mmetsp:Transcript_85563/g.133726  ORF Transcript_85563/g.133726 Transcript_85563/m.133726 type:complete len:549 (+) Transcript_85563:31-1677(+)
MFAMLLRSLCLALVTLEANAKVSCGNHHAQSCEACPQGNGASWCNGDCIWQQNRCVSRSKKSNKPNKPKESNYYDVLEIPHDADDAAIKKAYRQKSLEFHPDKCTLDKETCQAKFIEASAAHDVLSDKDKRKTYDEHGEEGLKEGGASDGNAEAMFRQFFGREPNGKVRIVRNGGQMMFMEEGEPGPDHNLYDDTDVIELQQESWNSGVAQRDEPWLIQFYKANVDDCVNVQEEYKQLSKTFSDFLSVAAINCRKQGKICQEAKVKSFPTVRWYPEDRNDEPDDYGDDISARLLGKYVNSRLKDFSSVISGKREMREWVDTQELPAVVLFSDKKETPPMWRALSREFRNRVAFGTVLNCDKTGVNKSEVQSVFDVRIPGVVHVDPVGELGTAKEKMEKGLKKKVIALRLQKIVGVAKNAGPAASFKEWTNERMQAGDCGPTDGQFCFLWLKAGADKQVEEAMRSLAVKYRTDPIKMMWVNVELNPSVLDAFGLENSDSSDFFIAYRSKRKRFKVHEGEMTFDRLDTFVDGVLNGGPLSSMAQVHKLEL